MKKLLHFSLFILLSFNMLFSQNLSVQNPSFEGPPGSHITPPLWGICMPGRTPDTQPGFWGINMAPSDGNSYLGLVDEPSSGWVEGASQELRNELTGNLESMQAGVTYQFDIDVSDHPTCCPWTVTGPVELLVWGGFSDCSEYELLWNSGDVPNFIWTTYNVSFTPSMSFSHIMFQVNAVTSSTGYLLVDNMSSIIDPCIPPQTSIVPTNFNGYNISCNGFSDGGIDLSVSGIGGYTYLWNNNATTEDITNLSAGIYNVVVTDSTGCFIDTSFILSEPIALQTSIVSTTNYNGYDISCNGYSDGGLDLSVWGFGYTYLWSNGATTEDITGLPIGTYNVDITDINSCTTSTGFTLTEPTPLQTTIASTDYNGLNVSCNGYSDGGLDLSVWGSVPGYTYLWSNGATTEDITGLPIGTYSIDITDINSCTTSTGFTLTEPTPLQTAIAPSTDYNGYHVSCNGYSDGGIALSVWGSVPGYTYLWSNGATTEDITGLPIGTYSVDITDINSCTTSTVFTLTEPTPLQTTIAASTDYNGYHVSCNRYSDGGIDLSVSGSVPGYTYLWSNGATTEDINNLSAGVYWVQITDLSGCFYSDTISISEPTLLQLTFYANGTSLTAAASGGTPPYNYEIYGPGSFFASSLGNTGTSFTTNLLVNGTYTFVATDDNGCTDSTTYLFILPSSIYDFSELGFKLYPNPTSGDISIDFLSFQKEVKISITDVQGKKVYLEKIFRNCERETISLKNLSKGAYVVLVETLEEQYSEVIIYK